MNDGQAVRRTLQQVLALIGYSVREARYKWTLVATTAATTLVLTLLAIVVNLDIVEGTLASARLLGGATFDLNGVPVADVVRGIQVAIIGMLNTLGLFLAFFVTGNVMPRTLVTGWVDLLVAQPLHRSTVVIGRALGAILVMTLNLAYLVIGSWAVLTWKTGFGNSGFLVGGILILATFAFCYTGMVLVGVVTRSSPVSIMAGVGIWFIGGPLYGLHANPGWNTILSAGWRRSLGTGIVETLYWTFPKTWQLSEGVIRATNAEAFDLSPIWLSMPFAAVSLALACWWFSRQDY